MALEAVCWIISAVTLLHWIISALARRTSFCTPVFVHGIRSFKFHHSAQTRIDRICWLLNSSSNHQIGRLAVQAGPLRGSPHPRVHRHRRAPVAPSFVHGPALALRHVSTHASLLARRALICKSTNPRTGIPSRLRPGGGGAPFFRSFPVSSLMPQPSRPAHPAPRKARPPCPLRRAMRYARAAPGIAARTTSCWQGTRGTPRPCAAERPSPRRT